MFTKLAMNKKIFQYTIFAIIVLSAGCTFAPTRKITHQPVHMAKDVNVGFTKDEVIRLMTEPIQRDVSGDREALQWCNTRPGEPDDFVLIWFKGGHVTEVKSYRNNGNYSDCPSGIRPVTFRGPDSVNEIRYR
jgi:hypothetical protein